MENPKFKIEREIVPGKLYLYIIDEFCTVEYLGKDNHFHMTAGKRTHLMEAPEKLLNRMASFWERHPALRKIALAEPERA